MNLFHVNFNLNHNGIFMPRIPENADFYTEEAETPRICFAPSLEGCLSSMPLGGYNLKESLEETNGGYQGIYFEHRKLSNTPFKYLHSRRPN